MTFEEYSLDWLRVFKGMRAYNTRRLYKNIIVKHLIPRMGKKEMQDISIMELQSVINSYSSKPATCRHIMLTIRQIFKVAKEENIINRNVYTFLKSPFYEASGKRILTAAERTAIRDIDCDEMSKVFVHILYCCGLRKGEALALTKDDIVGNEISVTKSMHFEKGYPVVGSTKTRSSARMVPMPDFLAEEVASYCKNISHKLFYEESGGYIRDSKYVNMWKNIVDRIDIATKTSTSLTAHVLRHNYATMLYYSNISVKQAARLMGHSNVNIMLNLYVHLDAESENVSEKINRIF